MALPLPLNRRRALAALCAAPLLSRAAALPGARSLPATLVQGRFFLETILSDGKPARLFTSTSGGMLATLEAGKRLGLALPNPNDRRAATPVAWASLVQDPRILAPALQPAAAGTATAASSAADLPLAALDGAQKVQLDGAVAWLGAPWFAHRHWTLDYLSGNIFINPPGTRLPEAEAHRIALGIASDAQGQRASAIPTLSISVAGETLRMALDTGASVMPTPAARSRLGAGAASVMGASFISASIAAAWRRKNPSWLWLAQADRFSKAAMIRVPTVAIAGQRTGPVWFTVLPDADLGPYLADWTDQPVVGAVGGSLLSAFRVTLDYPGGQAWFETV